MNRRIRITQSISIPLGLVISLIGAIILTIIAFTFFYGSNTGFVLPMGRSPPQIRAINSKIDRPFFVGCVEPDVSAPRANAALVILARNSEIDGVVDSIKSIERHFNRWFHYPYVFLNDERFSRKFRRTVMNYTSGAVQFGVIGKDLWEFPSWAKEDEVKEGIAAQGDRNIMYGGMASYHHMCRFYSGRFYKHPLLQKYDWYWRVEPDIKYFCDITYDPFIYMEQHNKVYGFTIAITELEETVPNLFRYTSGFKQANNITSKGMWEMFIAKDKDSDTEKTLPDDILASDDDKRKKDKSNLETMNGERYNMCHFWSNFEIARLDFFRSKEYNDYFEALDLSGGFWNERWGDAPVHSLATGLFLSPSQVHYFRDIGYRHTTIQHCPANAPGLQLPRQPYFFGDPTNRDVLEEDEYWDNIDPERENGVGCRCVCDTDVKEVEGKEGSCLNEWVQVVGGWTT
ncbi:glycosyltransferase family 15 protein [Tortispora caseinolytica NRRL Y-17796]|uniref:Glycosyltransferase family 15 protein n=1 Tax=Tortispora caseinolytica NRRL Y-17796 TaxID=767744 RepID=A0A1E4TIZ2_9ASCO|nr:glycosyltransferase family 15 protein [Tortispora caseinolytica NRRL Y-17796]